MKKACSIILLAVFLIYGCSSNRAAKHRKHALREVSMTINIQPGNSRDINMVNLDYYKQKVRDELNNFLNVRLNLVNADENPEVILNLAIENFTVWPIDQQVSRRILSRSVQVGTDATGRPIFQTVQASVDIVRVQQRSNALFRVDLQYKDNPARTVHRSFSSNYTYSNTFVDNVQGDPRAVDPSIYFSRSPGIEPREDDFLLALSKKDMLGRISLELRSYYK
ncbi:MAG TPA: hypothetical protein VEV16_11565 [Daejeonella sp.]|nr:hypothetical protein [Daejeonella sp.]